MEDASITINGLLGLAAIVGGLFCKRWRSAVIVGLCAGLAYAALVFLVISSNDLPNTDMVNVIGRLVGATLAMITFALIAHLVRRGVGALFRRKQV
jgi:hypothetical protein